MIEFLDRPIAYHRAFVAIGAGITGAVMLSQAVYWAKRSGANDGWFYKTQAEWQDETGLTRYEQEGARKKLRQLGVIEEAKRGVPCKTYYRINETVLENLIIQYGENQQTRMRKTSSQGRGKPAAKAGENQQSITETTQRSPETTTEIKTRKRAAKLPAMDDFDLSSWPEKPSQQIWDDWMRVRKEKRAKATQTAFDLTGAQLHAAKAHGFSVDDCIGKAVERSWAGFEVGWMLNATGGNNAGGYMSQGQGKTDEWKGIDADGKF